MLRREVITDPAQIAPLAVQVRSVRPRWRRFLLGLLFGLGACCQEPAPELPTWWDAASEIAYGQCSRWIECGTETRQTWQECVDDLVWDFCDQLYHVYRPGTQCLDTYTGNHSLEEVSRCSMWYAQVTCGQWVEPCEL